MAKMKCKVTKKMASMIAKALKKRGVKFEECVVDTTTSEVFYCMNVKSVMEDIWDARDNGDYDWGTGEYKFIRITYPYNYHNCPCYFTTARLLSVLRRLRSRGIDVDSDVFLDAICDEVEV